MKRFQIMVAVLALWLCTPGHAWAQDAPQPLPHQVELERIDGRWRLPHILETSQGTNLRDTWEGQVSVVVLNRFQGGSASGGTGVIISSEPALERPGYCNAM